MKISFYHLLLEHIFRGEYWKGKAEHKQINIAMDCAINQHIENLPEGGVTLKSLEEALDMKLEEKKEFEYYLEKILEKKEEEQEEQAQDPDQSCNGGQGGEGEPDENQEDQGSGNGNQESDEENDEDSDGESDENQEKEPEERGYRDMSDGTKDHDWEESAGQSEDLAKEQLKQMANEAYNEAVSKSRGSMPGGIEDLIKKMNTPAEIPWQTIFKRMKGSIPWGQQPSLIKTNRRHPFSPIHAGRVAARTIDVYVMRDVSGSMYGELEYVTNEIHGMLANTPARITLVDWDAGITDISLLRDAKMFNNNKKKQEKTLGEFKGGWGTDPTEAIEWFNDLKKPHGIVVILSDFQ